MCVLDLNCSFADVDVFLQCCVTDVNNACLFQLHVNAAVLKRCSWICVPVTSVTFTSSLFLLFHFLLFFNLSSIMFFLLMSPSLSLFSVLSSSLWSLLSSYVCFSYLISSTIYPIIKSEICKPLTLYRHLCLKQKIRLHG